MCVPVWADLAGSHGALKVARVRSSGLIASINCDVQFSRSAGNPCAFDDNLQLDSESLKHTVCFQFAVVECVSVLFSVCVYMYISS